MQRQCKSHYGVGQGHLHICARPFQSSLPAVHQGRFAITDGSTRRRPRGVPVSVSVVRQQSGPITVRGDEMALSTLAVPSCVVGMHSCRNGPAERANSARPTTFLRKFPIFEMSPEEILQGGRCANRGRRASLARSSRLDRLGDEAPMPILPTRTTPSCPCHPSRPWPLTLFPLHAPPLDALLWRPRRCRKRRFEAAARPPGRSLADNRCADRSAPQESSSCSSPFD